jgi:TIR domain
MAKIFISYRREDTESDANHLKSELEKYVGKGKVFLDSKGINLGVTGRDALQRIVKGSDCLLALIGPKWLNIEDSETKQRRLDNPDDFVRQEIRGALKDKKMPVVPVLVGNARMPEPKDLPDELKELASRQNFELRQRRWEGDVRALAEGLKLVSRSTLAKSRTGIKVAVAASLLPAALICGLLISSAHDRGPDAAREVSALKADVNDLRTHVNDLTTEVRGLELHHPITLTASHGNIRNLTGDTTAQLNRQELARHRSDAETRDNGILGFFGSLFH